MAKRILSLLLVLCLALGCSACGTNSTKSETRKEIDPGSGFD